MTVYDFPVLPSSDDSSGADTFDETEQHRGQLRFAERFVREHRGTMLHVHGLGWHQYDHTRWVQSRDGAEIRAMVATIKMAQGDLAALEKPARDDLVKDIQKCESLPGMNGVLGIAGTQFGMSTSADKLDADAHLLNTSSGTIDLRTNRVRPAKPADLLSKVTAGAFAPDARSDVLDTFLCQVLPDAEKRAFVARALGSALLGVVREQRLIIFYGVGANGKGTLRDLVVHAMGEYAVEVPADILLASKYGAQHLAPERMRLKGTRMAFCSEIPEGARMDEATMKKLTGGDPVTGKLLYHNPVEFEPSHTLFMLTNFLPVVRGDDPAVWRRILAVPFDVVVPLEDRDGELPEKLKACPDAVVAWLWAGWLDYCQQGLNPPASVLAATKAYEHDSDILARFLSDETAVSLSEPGREKSAALYKGFQDWARAQGEPTEMSNKAFTKALDKRGFEKGTDKRGAFWRGVSLVPAEQSSGSGPSS